MSFIINDFLVIRYVVNALANTFRLVFSDNSHLASAYELAKLTAILQLVQSMHLTINLSCMIYSEANNHTYPFFSTCDI
jgi:hypothetical protein